MGLKAAPNVRLTIIHETDNEVFETKINKCLADRKELVNLTNFPAGDMVHFVAIFRYEATIKTGNIIQGDWPTAG